MITNIIIETIKSTINEINNNVNYRLENTEDGIDIEAFINNKEIGGIVIEVLYDPYSYEFDDVFTEDEFDELFKADQIVKFSHLEVDDNFKDLGIGSELMKRGLQSMKQKGYKEFYLNASPMGFSGLNLQDLVDFYKKFGFQSIKNQGGNVLMRLILN